MGILVAVFGFFAIGASDNAQQFAKHSNGVDEYTIVMPRSCPSGVRESGYSWSVASGIMLKQNNEDGSVGPVCVEK